MGTWSFRARKGGNYARTYVRARAPPLAAAGRPGSGSGSGSGSLPGLVLFESGLAGMDCKHTRTGSNPPANRPLRVSWTANSCDCWAANRHDCWVERVRPLVLGSNLLGTSGRLYKGLQFSIEKYTIYNTNNFSSLSL